MERTQSGFKQGNIEVIRKAEGSKIYGRLSHREAQLLLLFFQGKNNKQLAKAMGIKRATVYSLWTNIFFKLGCDCAAHAIARAVQLKMIRVYSILTVLAVGGIYPPTTSVTAPRQIPRTARVIRTAQRASGRQYG